MRTARRYLAREIYRSCAVVLLALLGLFTFFALVDDLDNVGDKFSMLALLYMQALALPTRLYDLLPIGLLIGEIGRASCRERVCQYVLISGGAVSFKKKTIILKPLFNNGI